MWCIELLIRRRRRLSHLRRELASRLQSQSLVVRFARRLPSRHEDVTLRMPTNEIEGRPFERTQRHILAIRHETQHRPRHRSRRVQHAAFRRYLVHDHATTRAVHEALALLHALQTMLAVVGASSQGQPGGLAGTCRWSSPRPMPTPQPPPARSPPLLWSSRR